MTETDLGLLRSRLFTPDGNENFATLFCGVAGGPGWTRLLVREVWPAPEDAYAQRQPYHLEIAPRFFNLVVDHCGKTGLSPVVIHSHGAGSATYSASDDFGESRLLKVLKQLLPSSQVGSLLITPSDLGGRIYHEGRLLTMGAVAVSGLESRLYPPPADDVIADRASWDRQVRAIGNRGQRQIGRLRVGVVGLGGTGSAVAEQLVRLGVGDLVFVDPDRLDASNVSRVFGSRASDGSKHALKVNVVSKYLKQVRSGVSIRTIADSVTRQSVVTALRDRDLVFGCTDNHLSRAILNRFAHQYLVPVIDMGIRLDARAGKVTSVAGRVTLVGVGMTCLRCSGHIDSDAIRAESLPPSERAALAREGYVQGIEEPAPAVISLNTTVASLAVTSGIALFAKILGRCPPVDQLYDASSGTVFVARPRHDPSCDVCSADGGLKALGDLQVVSAYE